MAPASRTARAAARIWRSLSTEQGPAITTTSSPPTVSPPGSRTMVDSGLPLARHLLVGLGDVEDFLDAGQRGQPRAVHPAVVADEADRRALLARHRPRLVAHLLDGGHDGLDLLLGRAVAHDDQHLAPRLRWLRRCPGRYVQLPHQAIHP